jgi:hypothetical protein
MRQHEADMSSILQRGNTFTKSAALFGEIPKFDDPEDDDPEAASCALRRTMSSSSRVCSSSSRSSAGAVVASSGDDDNKDMDKLTATAKLRRLTRSGTQKDLSTKRRLNIHTWSSRADMEAGANARRLKVDHQEFKHTAFKPVLAFYEKNDITMDTADLEEEWDRSPMPRILMPKRVPQERWESPRRSSPAEQFNSRPSSAAPSTRPKLQRTSKRRSSLASAKQSLRSSIASSKDSFDEQQSGEDVLHELVDLCGSTEDAGTLAEWVLAMEKDGRRSPEAIAQELGKIPNIPAERFTKIVLRCRDQEKAWLQMFLRDRRVFELQLEDRAARWQTNVSKSISSPDVFHSLRGGFGTEMVRRLTPCTEFRRQRTP